MPVIKNSSYKAPFRYRNRHLQTIFPTLFRKVKGLSFQRERIFTADGDFIDLDYSTVNSKKAVILCHGLEGNSRRVYMKGMAKIFNSNGIDAICINYRGCSGEDNLKKKSYTAGSIDDLEEVINAVLNYKKYETLFIIGFSLGGNLVLKYAGVKGNLINNKIKGIIAISAACNLASAAKKLNNLENWIYQKLFLQTLLKKIRRKSKQYPELKEINLKSIKTMGSFDDLVIAPLHGYLNASDYWEKCSALKDLPNIKVPTLMITAQDDTILGESCYPFKEAEDSRYLYLEVPETGGHLGFMQKPNDEHYWHEKRTIQFIKETIGIN